MKLEKTIYSNVKLVIDEFNIPVAVRIGKKQIHLYDKVCVIADIHGYICPSIKKEGIGRIVEIRRDNTGHFFGVLMTSFIDEFEYVKPAEQFGYVKPERIEVIF